MRAVYWAVANRFVGALCLLALGAMHDSVRCVSVFALGGGLIRSLGGGLLEYGIFLEILCRVKEARARALSRNACTRLHLLSVWKDIRLEHTHADGCL